MPPRRRPTTRTLLRLLPLVAVAGLLLAAAPAAAGHPSVARAAAALPSLEPLGAVAVQEPEPSQPATASVPDPTVDAAQAACVPRSSRSGMELRPPVRRDLLAERSAEVQERTLPQISHETSGSSTAPRCLALARWCLRHSTATSFA